jgi:hypothetical protein
MEQIQQLRNNMNKDGKLPDKQNKTEVTLC